MLGNIKAFILIISSAAVFTILLVTGNTMAMSIRERTREVAVLKTLGFTRGIILGLFVGEAVAIAAIGGGVGTLIALLFFSGGGHGPQGANLFVLSFKQWEFTAPTALGVAVF